MSLLVTVFLVSTSLQADVVPGRWEKVEALSSGKSIILTLKTGDRTEVVFKSLTADSLAVVDPSTGEFTVPRSQVKMVSVDEDGTTDGTVVGLVSGLAVGGLFGALIGNAFENR